MGLQRRKDATESGRRGSRRYSRSTRYSSKTAREENWGPVGRRIGYSYHQRQSGNDWEYFSGSWKLKKNRKTGDTAAINSETRKIGFGEFADWAYAEVIMRKKGYSQFLLWGPNPNFRTRNDSSIGFDTKRPESQWMSTL